ncbi:UPF0577 protein [Fasciola hepatica]|uniref:UPF0577 protein n=1 Tax=Fasciola hepatica TaxID=6192 RepID=A0A4E0S0A3_FASHE|nr:UPF0577 protein [Fasciola hepatica]
MAFFTIRNSHCSQTPGTSFLLQHTGQNAYLNLTSKIPKGESVLQWYLFTENNVFRSIFGAPDSIIKISKVRITGTPPILRCTDCPAGTFSRSPRSYDCETCPANTFSISGSDDCKPCGPGQYSDLPRAQNPDGVSVERGPRAQKMITCTTGPAVMRTDRQVGVINIECGYFYYDFGTEANCLPLQRRKQWKWIEPSICNRETGVPLPQPEAPVPCDPCPLGTTLVEGNRCELCSRTVKNVSRSTKTCISCDKDHITAHGIIYSTWSYLPPLVETRCQNAFTSSCQPWVLDDNFISSGVGLHPHAVSTLTLSLPNGFVRSDNIVLDSWSQVTLIPPVPDTYLDVDFEVQCALFCELQLRQQQVERDEYMVRSWTGSVPRQNFTLHIKDSRPTNFTWSFRKMTPNQSIFDRDHVRIYRIQVTNAEGLGVVGCRRCLKGMQNGKCIDCPRGLFYVEVTNQTTHQTVINCTQCPANHVVLADSTVARSISEACIPCEPGTRSINSSLCVLDTVPTTPNGIQYNVTQFLSTEHRINGTRMFTPSGNRYAHEFRLFLTYGKTTECVEQISSTPQSKVNALICRHTCVWTSTNPEKTVYTKPIRHVYFSTDLMRSKLANPHFSPTVSLADRMVKAIPSNISQSFWDEINENLTRAGWTPDTTGGDLHYMFETDDVTASCPHGRKAMVTLRCGFVFDYGLDDLYAGGMLEVPPSCPDGTCDGCLYHFLWTGLQACPICRKEDYHKIVGECHYGKQTIYWNAPRGCRIGEGTLLREVQSCPMVTKSQLAGIILTVLVVCLLSLTILVCHRRNKRLQYKYMKLIQNAESKAQQPTSCALEPEEDNVDTFSRRAIRPDGLTNLGLELEPTALASISSFPKLQLPRVGPIVFKSKTDTDGQCLPENEVVG